MDDLQKQAIKNVIKYLGIGTAALGYIVAAITLAMEFSPWFWLMVGIPIAGGLFYSLYLFELQELKRQERVKLAEESVQGLTKALRADAKINRG